MNQIELPIVDLRQPDLSQVLDRICRTMGFFQLVGHDVPMSTRERLALLARAFFALSLEEKCTVEQPTPRTIRGYIPMGRAALAYTRNDTSPPDLKESFNVGPPSPARTEDSPHYAGNCWPAQPPELKSTCIDYYRAMEVLSHRLLQHLSLAAGFAKSDFDQATEGHVSVLGMMYYPTPEGTPLPGQLRSGAHCDFGTITLLWPERGSIGLEVYYRDQWTPVTAAPQALIVNIGDVLAHWTDGRWQSVLHRVIIGEPRGAPLDRLSIGYFQHPNPDVSLRSIDSGDSMTFGDYLSGKFDSQVRQTE